MDVLFVITSAVLLIFGFVVAFGAPYLPTLGASTPDIFTLLALKKGQHLLELGSGDGRVLKAAAKQGIRCTGYELNPLLVIFSRLYTWRYRHLVTIKWGNYWQATWPPADGIYAFILQKYMQKLDNKIVQEVSKPVKLVSYAFEVPERTPDKVIKGMQLYIYR